MTPNASAGIVTLPSVSSSGNIGFDIVATYYGLLSSDPDLTMPVAAIESLVHLLASTPDLSTISETLAVLEANVKTLKQAIPNSISLSAGTDLFMRYLITTLRPGSSTDIGAGGDFKSIRKHLLSNAQVFVSRAKDARQAIAAHGKRFVREGSTVLTTGGSRAVLAALQTAASEQTHGSGAPRFKVIYVMSSTTSNESAEAVASLRKLSVPVAVVPESAVAYCMRKVSFAMVGAEGVVESGGIISRLGTYQLALVCKSSNKPVYVMAEKHKFVRMFPLHQFDLGFDQHILDFSDEPQAAEAGVDMAAERTPQPKDAYFETESKQTARRITHEDAVDYTPPKYITALVTEAGILTPSAVSEELIKIWY